MPTSDPPQLSGWGLLFAPGRELLDEDLERLTANDAITLSRGLGRAYGDSALPAPGGIDVAGTRLADRILSWDPETGLLRAEAGLALIELNRLFLNRGWFTPVTPGTAFVTLGGMVAADVHGKNHHVNGCFGAHVTQLRIRVADGRVIDCSPTEEPDLFHATVGGMGLTGHILEVEFPMQRVSSPWIYGESERIPNIDAFTEGLTKAAEDYPATMGWLDCLSTGKSMGRGILYRGRWATPDEAPDKPVRAKKRITFPLTPPSFLLNSLSIRAFNAVLYRSHIPRIKRGVQHPEVFYYPLDKIRRWNRMYGRKGFTQYQCVLPRAAGPDAARRFLEVLTKAGGASFLCVIKDCGPEGKGILSFPRPGMSIALDIPVRSNTQALVDRLNEATIAEGGRIYLAKDQFTRADHFAEMEGERLTRFMEIRRTWDPGLKIRSAQSVRLFGDPAP
jgi:FAD/FMN-containing dehydrogenase